MLLYTSSVVLPLQVLTTEMSKVYKTVSTETMQGPFCVIKNHCNLRNLHYFTIPSTNTVYHGSGSISNLGLRIWNVVPERKKNIIVSAPSKMKSKSVNLRSARVSYVTSAYLKLVFCNPLQVTWPYIYISLSLKKPSGFSSPVLQVLLMIVDFIKKIQISSH